jgi:hypothetical protein
MHRQNIQHLLGQLCDGPQKAHNIHDLESTLFAFKDGLLPCDEQRREGTCNNTGIFPCRRSCIKRSSIGTIPFTDGQHIACHWCTEYTSHNTTIKALINECTHLGAHMLQPWCSL